LPVSNAHLHELEAEAIHALREAAAVFAKPVILYSIGKDSSVLLHLALKAFYPARPPFTLLHVDTTWKFREMIAFRDRRMKELGLPLVVHVNRDGLARGIGPFSHGASVHTDIMKTEALKQALDLHGFDAAIGGARCDEEPSRAKERIFSLRSASHRWDPRSQRPELWHLYNGRLNARASASFPCRTGPSSTSGPLSRARTFPSCRSTSRRGAWWSSAAAC
jgi:sulfate adenylyltransferase subunit 2